MDTHIYNSFLQEMCPEGVTPCTYNELILWSNNQKSQTKIRKSIFEGLWYLWQNAFGTCFVKLSSFDSNNNIAELLQQFVDSRNNYTICKAAFDEFYKRRYNLSQAKEIYKQFIKNDTDIFVGKDPETNDNIFLNTERGYMYYAEDHSRTFKFPMWYNISEGAASFGFSYGLTYLLSSFAMLYMYDNSEEASMGFESQDNVTNSIEVAIKDQSNITNADTETTAEAFKYAAKTAVAQFLTGNKNAEWGKMYSETFKKKIPIPSGMFLQKLVDEYGANLFLHFAPVGYITEMPSFNNFLKTATTEFSIKKINFENIAVVPLVPYSYIFNGIENNTDPIQLYSTLTIGFDENNTDIEQFYTDNNFFPSDSEMTNVLDRVSQISKTIPAIQALFEASVSAPKLINDIEETLKSFGNTTITVVSSETAYEGILGQIPLNGVNLLLPKTQQIKNYTDLAKRWNINSAMKRCVSDYDFKTIKADADHFKTIKADELLSRVKTNPAYLKKVLNAFKDPMKISTDDYKYAYQGLDLLFNKNIDAFKEFEKNDKDEESSGGWFATVASYLNTASDLNTDGLPLEDYIRKTLEPPIQQYLQLKDLARKIAFPIEVGPMQDACNAVNSAHAVLLKKVADELDKYFENLNFIKVNSENNLLSARSKNVGRVISVIDSIYVKLAGGGGVWGVLNMWTRIVSRFRFAVYVGLFKTKKWTTDLCLYVPRMIGNYAKSFVYSDKAVTNSRFIVPAISSNFKDIASSNKHSIISFTH